MLPRLDYLVILAPDSVERVFVRDWIFERDMFDGRIEQDAEECSGIVELIPQAAIVEPSHAGVCQPRAFWMSDEDVPVMVQMLPHVILDMIARRFRRQQITRPRIPSASSEGITDSARIRTLPKRGQNNCMEPTGGTPGSLDVEELFIVLVFRRRRLMQSVRHRGHGFVLQFGFESLYLFAEVEDLPSVGSEQPVGFEQFADEFSLDFLRWR